MRQVVIVCDGSGSVNSAVSKVARMVASADSIATGSLAWSVGCMIVVQMSHLFVRMHRPSKPMHDHGSISAASPHWGGGA
ncbi:MAG: hypothetical protein CMJ63_00010 [Planctomycetaceae bacterium]|nr:hypothetical protein [Planctomycetaceae bacterium]